MVGEARISDADVQRRMEEAEGIIATMPEIDVRAAVMELAKEDPRIWNLVFRRLKGQPLAFDVSHKMTPPVLSELEKELPPHKYVLEVRRRQLMHRPFLVEPLLDQHPWKVYKKARQTGVSELSITEVIHYLYANDGVKWIYTFPRDTQLNQFATTRINEAFKETPRIRAILGRPDGIYLKRISKSFMFLRSAWESNLGEGIDADGVTLDEKDRMKEGVEVAFKESLSSSQFGGMFREVSTPTLPGRGVDASYQISDQRCWLVRCTRCGLEQEIEWPDNIVQMIDDDPGQQEIPDGAYEYQCRKTSCRGMLDRMHGRYVAKRPSIKEVRGYHIPQMIAPWISATELMRKKKKYKFLQLWTNYCRGDTSQGEHILLLDQHFINACAGHPLILRRSNVWRNISVGVDWGNTNWALVIGENVHTGLPYILNCIMQPDTKEELGGAKLLADRIAPYEPDVVVADLGFGKDRVQHLLRRFGEGRVFGCNYNPATKGNRSFQPVWSNDASARVTVDRTMAIKEFCRAVRDMELGLPDLEHMDIKRFMAHCKAMAPMYETDDNDESVIVEVIKSNADDHLAHCGTYAWLGYDKVTSGSHFQYDYVDYK